MPPTTKCHPDLIHRQLHDRLMLLQLAGSTSIAAVTLRTLTDSTASTAFPAQSGSHILVGHFLEILLPVKILCRVCFDRKLHQRLPLNTQRLLLGSPTTCNPQRRPHTRGRLGCQLDAHTDGKAGNANSASSSNSAVAGLAASRLPQQARSKRRYRRDDRHDGHHAFKTCASRGATHALCIF